MVKHLLRREGPGQAAGNDLSTGRSLERPEFHVKSNDCGRGEEAGGSETR